MSGGYQAAFLAARASSNSSVPPRATFEEAPAPVIVHRQIHVRQAAAAAVSVSQLQVVSAPSSSSSSAAAGAGVGSRAALLEAREWQKISNYHAATHQQSIQRGREIPLSAALRKHSTALDGTKMSLASCEMTDIDKIPAATSLRVKTLFLGTNNLFGLDNVQQFLNLSTLSISNNCIRYIETLRPLGLLEHLDKLSLEGNVVCSMPYYREQVLNLCPHLSTFDNKKVSAAERSGLRQTTSRLAGKWTELCDQELRCCALVHAVMQIRCCFELVSLSSREPPSLGFLGRVLGTGGVFRWAQVGCHEIFSRVVQDMGLRANLQVQRKLTQGQRLHLSQRAEAMLQHWDSITNECGEYQRQQLAHFVIAYARAIGTSLSTTSVSLVPALRPGLGEAEVLSSQLPMEWCVGFVDSISEATIMRFGNTVSKTPCDSTFFVAATSTSTSTFQSASMSPPPPPPPLPRPKTLSKPTLDKNVEYSVPQKPTVFPLSKVSKLAANAAVNGSAPTLKPTSETGTRYQQLLSRLLPPQQQEDDTEIVNSSGTSAVLKTRGKEFGQLTSLASDGALVRGSSNERSSAQSVQSWSGRHNEKSNRPSISPSRSRSPSRGSSKPSVSGKTTSLSPARNATRVPKQVQSKVSVPRAPSQNRGKVAPVSATAKFNSLSSTSGSRGADEAMAAIELSSARFKALVARARQAFPLGDEEDLQLAMGRLWQRPLPQLQLPSVSLSGLGLADVQVNDPNQKLSTFQSASISIPLPPLLQLYERSELTSSIHELKSQIQTTLNDLALYQRHEYGAWITSQSLKRHCEALNHSVTDAAGGSVAQIASWRDAAVEWHADVALGREWAELLQGLVDHVADERDRVDAARSRLADIFRRTEKLRADRALESQRRAEIDRSTEEVRLATAALLHEIEASPQARERAQRHLQTTAALDLAERARWLLRKIFRRWRLRVRRQQRIARFHRSALVRRRKQTLYFPFRQWARLIRVVRVSLRLQLRRARRGARRCLRLWRQRCLRTARLLRLVTRKRRRVPLLQALFRWRRVAAAGSGTRLESRRLWLRASCFIKVRVFRGWAAYTRRCSLKLDPDREAHLMYSAHMFHLATIWAAWVAFSRQSATDSADAQRRANSKLQLARLGSFMFSWRRQALASRKFIRRRTLWAFVRLKIAARRRRRRRIKLQSQVLPLRRQNALRAFRRRCLARCMYRLRLAHCKRLVSLLRVRGLRLRVWRLWRRGWDFAEAERRREHLAMEFYLGLMLRRHLVAWKEVALDRGHGVRRGRVRSCLDEQLTDTKAWVQAQAPIHAQVHSRGQIQSEQSEAGFEAKIRFNGDAESAAAETSTTTTTLATAAAAAEVALEEEEALRLNISAALQQQLMLSSAAAASLSVADCFRVRRLSRQAVNAFRDRAILRRSLRAAALGVQRRNQVVTMRSAFLLWQARWLGSLLDAGAGAACSLDPSVQSSTYSVDDSPQALEARSIALSFEVSQLRDDHTLLISRAEYLRSGLSQLAEYELDVENATKEAAIAAGILKRELDSARAAAAQLTRESEAIAHLAQQHQLIQGRALPEEALVRQQLVQTEAERDTQRRMLAQTETHYQQAVLRQSQAQLRIEQLQAETRAALSVSAHLKNRADELDAEIERLGTRRRQSERALRDAAERARIAQESVESPAQTQQAQLMELEESMLSGRLEVARRDEEELEQILANIAMRQRQHRPELQRVPLGELLVPSVPGTDSGTGPSGRLRATELVGSTRAALVSAQAQALVAYRHVDGPELQAEILDTDWEEFGQAATSSANILGIGSDNNSHGGSWRSQTSVAVKGHDHGKENKLGQLGRLKPVKGRRTAPVPTNDPLPRKVPAIALRDRPNTVISLRQQSLRLARPIMKTTIAHEGQRTTEDQESIVWQRLKRRLGKGEDV